jgi:hypothetical protein
LKNASRWEKTELLRKYISQLEMRATGDSEFSEKISDYVKWAKEKLDWYDPAVSKPDELLNNVDNERLEFVSIGPL